MRVTWQVHTADSTSRPPFFTEFAIADQVQSFEMTAIASPESPAALFLDFTLVAKKAALHFRDPFLHVCGSLNRYYHPSPLSLSTLPAAVKPAELRRSPSDISSSMVVRRWSGASDTSISLDWSSNGKDVESPVASVVPSFDGKVSNLNNDNAKMSVSELERKAMADGALKGVSFGNSEQLFKSNKNDSNLGSDEVDVSKDKVREKAWYCSWMQLKRQGTLARLK
ncbi:GPI-anchored adhesin-like protein [Perilla frutescens var. hirtella]|nr:GPI-anchored adhesin-like protein [Perilla frutescens var. hirtella]